MRPDWQVRVIEEKAQLDERRGRLDLFIGSGTYARIEDEDRALLLTQAELMKELSRVLGDRIKRFKA